MKKNKLILSLLGLVGLFMVIIGGLQGFSLFSGQSFSLLGESVWIPQYWTAECVTRSEHLSEKQITSHTDNPRFYQCTSSESGTYVPLVSGAQCEYRVANYGTLTAYICDGTDATKDDLDSSMCTKERGFFSGSSESSVFRVNAGDSIYIDSDKVFGDADLYAKYPAYGLRVRSQDGFVNPTTLSCEINSINQVKYHTLDAGSRTEILPNVPMNVVSGLSQAYSNQLVTLEDVERGKPIYITRPQYYYLVSEAEDGFKFVDTSAGERFSSNIECIPRTTGCSDDAKIIQLEKQSCDEFGGAITNYAPVQGDSTQLCKYSCSSGELEVTNQCIEVQKSCPSDKPLWDTTTGQCSAVQPAPENEDLDYSWLVILVIGLGMIYFARRMTKK